MPGAVWAQEGAPDFLPGGQVFAPLLADPHEPRDGILRRMDENHYDCSLGGSLDLFRWKLPGDGFWAWGIQGKAFLSITDFTAKFLDQSFRLEDLDLGWGAYLSESSGSFSTRLGFLRTTSQLGPYEIVKGGTAIDYRREGSQLLESFRVSPSLRLYGGLGFWFSTVPTAPALYGQLGAEASTGFSRIEGGLYGLFFACDLNLGYESLGVLDGNFEAGVQRKGGAGSPGLRLAVLYADANSPYGQFADQRDSHWSLAFFLDP
jgi:hypothetical protein